MVRGAAGPRIALSGVPGTGKTTLADHIGARHDVVVVHLNEFAQEAGLLNEQDPERGSYYVDLDALNERYRERYDGEERPVLLEGHFAHEMDVDRIVLLRVDPQVLIARLRARGWREEKVRENVEAEALDVLAQEVLDVDAPASELDASDLGVEEAAAAVWAIAENDPKAFMRRSVGTAKWSLEALPWF